MNYVVKTNGRYLNCFRTYSEARDFADEIHRRYGWQVEVELA